ncbi:MAG TPA: TIM-barrel domain-containing protein [Bryobacteraceae bacterium]|nr:TIM-barrel domain-containing protein [Bryobacteraceae bacterium]
MPSFASLLRGTAACAVLCSAAFAAADRIPNGVQLSTEKMNVKVQFYSPTTVRVLKWTAAGKPDKLSLSVIQKDVPNLSIAVSKTPASVTLASAWVEVEINTADGTVRFLDVTGRAVLAEQGAATFAPTGLSQEKSALNVQQNFTLSADEGIYGLGQHQTGYMNYRGRTVKLVQSNTDAVTPMLVSTAGYGLFWDNYSKTVFSDDPAKMSLWSEVADNVDYYFIYGPSMDLAIAGYRHLTGEAPLYGKWAYGYWQSKEHYATRDELLGIAAEYRKRQIPIDNIVQDWNYWGDNSMWGALVFDEKKYPRPAEMIDELHKEHFHLMISIWGGLGPASPIYKDMEKRGYLYSPVGWAGFRYYDAYNPAANDLYWQYANKGLFSKGVDAWWMDSTEPDIVNALTKDSHEFEMKRVENNHIGSFARYLNPYSLVITEGMYQRQRATTEQKRVYILTRSTFAGQQRAAATTWSGDIGADWSVFRKQISAGVNHSMAGIPYWTFDIGAYSLGCQGGTFMNGGKDPAYQELYTRMFQFGAFAPIFRSHGSETPREIWEFGDYTPTLIKFDNLRYRLLPYTYSLGWRVTHDGYSIMRGLAMDFTADKKSYNIDDQFMFGPAIMVSPVTEYQEHRPPELGVVIGPENFRTEDGKPGLDAKYYCDAEFKTLCHEAVEPGINLFWYTGWPEFIKNPRFSMRWEGRLVPTATGTYRFNMKSFGPRRVFLNGEELKHNYDSMESWTVPVELAAGKEYDFAFETSNTALGAFRAQLFWKTPAIHADEKKTEPRKTTRDVYLPAGTQWFDFWTGEAHPGGATLTVDAPVTTMPLMVRAGSIVPMGPFIQYSTEKPADPIELRIYPGADGDFTLYEDENDNYDYEKGVHATIAFHWNDAKHALTIGAREGSFPGMLQKRTFDVVLVGKAHGAGVDPAATPDRVVAYTGSEARVSFAR